MNHCTVQISPIKVFSLLDMPLLDEEFDQELFIEDPEMLLDASSHSIHCIGESNEF